MSIGGAARAITQARSSLIPTARSFLHKSPRVFRIIKMSDKKAEIIEGVFGMLKTSEYRFITTY
jgi:hypothetical protein